MQTLLNGIESRDSKTYLDTSVHSSFILNRQKVETTQVSIANEWTIKLWHEHSKELDSAINRNEIGIPATEWERLENIALSEMSHIDRYF